MREIKICLDSDVLVVILQPNDTMIHLAAKIYEEAVLRGKKKFLKIAMRELNSFKPSTNPLDKKSEIKVNNRPPSYFDNSLENYLLKTTAKSSEAKFYFNKILEKKDRKKQIYENYPNLYTLLWAAKYGYVQLVEASLNAYFRQSFTLSDRLIGKILKTAIEFAAEHNLSTALHQKFLKVIPKESKIQHQLISFIIKPDDQLESLGGAYLKMNLESTSSIIRLAIQHKKLKMLKELIMCTGNCFFDVSLFFRSKQILPLEFALQKKDEEMITLFIEAGANLDLLQEDQSEEKIKTIKQEATLRFQKDYLLPLAKNFIFPFLDNAFCENIRDIIFEYCLEKESILETASLAREKLISPLIEAMPLDENDSRPKEIDSYKTKKIGAYEMMVIIKKYIRRTNYFFDHQVTSTLIFILEGHKEYGYTMITPIFREALGKIIGPQAVEKLYGHDEKQFLLSSSSLFPTPLNTGMLGDKSNSSTPPPINRQSPI